MTLALADVFVPDGFSSHTDTVGLAIEMSMFDTLPTCSSTSLTTRIGRRPFRQQSVAAASSWKICVLQFTDRKSRSANPVALTAYLYLVDSQ